MKIEMRVLPFCGMIAPRLPFEKSYSALIVLALLSRCTTGRDQPILVIALRIDNNQQLAGASKTDGNEASLTLGVRILDGNGERVLQHAFGIGKRNSVFS